MLRRTEIVKWVAENRRPFTIVKDAPFLWLMKTGRPNLWIPSPKTVSRDVQQVFIYTRNRIARMLLVRQIHASKEMKLTHTQAYAGKLNFSADAWTAGNHKALVAFCVHLEKEGWPISFLLDIVEVAKVRMVLSLSQLLTCYGCSLIPELHLPKHLRKC